MRFRRVWMIAVLSLAVVAAGTLTVGAQPRPPMPIKESFYPPDGSQNVWAGTQISGSFAEALDKASLEANFSLQPAATGHFNWSSEQYFEYLPDEPLAPGRQFKATLGTGVRTARGQPVFPQPFSWSFSVDPGQAQVSFGYGLPIQLVTPSGKHGVRVDPGYPRMTLDFALYALDMPAFATRYAKMMDPQRKDLKIDLTGLTHVATWSAHVDTMSGTPEVKLPAGTAASWYVIDARSPRVGDGQAILFYTDYALMAKRGLDGLTVWATRFPSGQPTVAADLQLYGADGRRLTGAAADGKGVARFAGTPSAAFVIAAVGDQQTLVGLDNNWYSGGYWWRWWDSTGWSVAPPEYRGHVHTDRPIYRPGHTVHYKATLRHIERDGYSVIGPATTVTVTIKDASGNTILRGNPTPDDFGSVAGDLKLGQDVTLGSWQIEVTTGRQSFYGGFQVQEYVKPDYEVTVKSDHPYYVRGDSAEITVQAKYYFGQPVAGGELTLRLFRGWYYRGGGNEVSEVTGTLGPDGTWKTTIRLDAAETYMEYVYFEAEVVDATRRPVFADSSAPVYPAAFDLTLANDQYGVEVGQPVVLTASTMSHDGQPVASRAVDVEVRQYTRYDFVTIKTVHVTTDADGKATVRLPGLYEGWYNVYAKARDDAGHEVTAYSYAWLYSGRQSWYWWGGLEVTTDHDSYAPGETAQLLIKSPYTTTALVTIERDEVYDEIVVPVSGGTTVQVPIQAKYAPNVWARVQLWQPLNDPYSRTEGQLVTAMTKISVPAVDKELRIEIVPDAPSHEPAEEATFTVRVRNAAGQPVDAQLSFALVDKAVLALAADQSGDIFDTFWGTWEHSVSSYDSLQVSYGSGYPERDSASPPRAGAPGGGQPTPTPSAAKGQNPDEASQATPRRYFPDTAYWKADIVTGPDGEAEVSLTLPDTLTTWKALVRAVTRSTEVGQGDGEMVVSKAVIADPALPRFAVQGDQFALDVLGRNYAGGSLDASCALDTPGLVQLDPGAKNLSLPFNETRFARWSVVASKLGENPVTARLETAGGTDVIELPLEVQPFAVPERFVTSGSTAAKTTETFEVPFNAVPDSSTVEIRLAPGMAVGVLDGLEDLIGYPYGCVEQTMSRMYPNAVVGRLVKVLSIDAPEITDALPEMMALGLQKLSGFQNSDGSWGWWHSDGNLYITAYVLHGLTLTQAAGFDVDSDVLERGFTWLVGALPQEQDPRLQAYAAYVLGQSGRGGEELKAVAEGLFGNRGKLDAFALAALAVTLNQVGRADLAGQAVDSLVAMAQITPTTAFWPVIVPYDKWDEYHWRSMASAEKNTAMALEALALLRPRSELAPKAARWLMEHRWGTSWRTTQGTAFAVLGLTDYIVASGELASAYDWTVSLDQEMVGSGHVDRANITQRIPPIVLTGDRLLAGTHTLTVEKNGTGTLFYTLVGQMALYYDGFAPTKAEGYGIHLTREYAPVSGRSDKNGWHVGDVLNVRLTVDTDEELWYLLIEDMLPAGFEALNEDLQTETSKVPGRMPPWRWWGYERKEVRDEKVSFFSTYMYPGQHTFEYAVRTVTPGTFSARPAQAYAMYRPEVWARSASEQVQVAADRVLARPPLTGDFDRDCRLTTFDASLVAADWSTSHGRDVNGDGRVDVVDIGVANGRNGLTCGDAVPALPSPAGDMTVRLRAPQSIRQGAEFDVEILAEGNGQIGGYELALGLPAGAFEVLGLTQGDRLPNATLLGPTIQASVVRLGGYAPQGSTAGGPSVLARLRLRALRAGDAKLNVASAQIVTDHGAAYRVTADGTVVSPNPWTPARIIYLPYAMR